MNPSLLRARFASCLLTLLVLVGCTGTQEDSIPVLLVVGSVETGNPQLQLFEDVRDPLANPPRNLVPIPGSVEPLPSPPVSFDVVDRNGERSELVVLDEGGVVHFFDLADLPGSFGTSRNPVNVADLIPADSAVGSAFCWRQLQVGGDSTQSGRYAAVLDSCSAEVTEVYVIDLIDERFLYALSLEHVAAQPLLPAGIYVDQATNRLYFATDEFTDTLVQSVPLAGVGAPLELGQVAIDPLTATDLAPLANGIGVLGEDLLAVIPFEGSASTPVDTELSSATSLLPDPSGNVELLVALSSTGAAILDGLEDDDPDTLFLQEPLADATLEPVQRFAYLLEEGGIEILDLFPYPEPRSDRLLFVDLPGLADPRAITWAFGTQ